MEMDTQLEQSLNEKGISFYVVPSVSLEEIDTEKSIAVQVRIGVNVDEVFVARYAQAMKRGERFPPLICIKNKKGMLEVLDGNNRIAAVIRAGLTEFSGGAYVLSNITEYDAKILACEINVKQGKTASVSDRAYHAIHLHACGLTQEEASARMGITTVTFQKYRNSIATKQTLTNLGVNKLENLNETHFDILKDLDGDEDVLKATADIVARGSYTPQATKALVKEIKDFPSGSTKMAHVKKIADENVAVQKKVKKGTVGIPKNFNAVVAKLRFATASIKDSKKLISNLSSSLYDEVSKELTKIEVEVEALKNRLKVEA